MHRFPSYNYQDRTNSLKMTGARKEEEKDDDDDDDKDDFITIFTHVVIHQSCSDQGLPVDALVLLRCSSVSGLPMPSGIYRQRTQQERYSL